MDLMIAAIASSRGLPLYTRNAQDFNGVDDMVTIIPV
jgi:toxin FitB